MAALLSFRSRRELILNIFMKNTNYFVQAAVIAAAYAALTLLLAPISFGPMQVRASEALIVLAYFTPAAVPGLTVGCFISNCAGAALGTSLGIMDVVVGTSATFISALMAARIKNKWLVPLPSVAINAFLVAWTLNVMLNVPYWFSVLWVGLGQTVACYAVGMPLLFILDKNREVIFKR